MIKNISPKVSNIHTENKILNRMEYKSRHLLYEETLGLLQIFKISISVGKSYDY